LGEKWTPYTSAVEVPFYVRWPGKIPAGARDGRLAANVDVLPSILAATGVAPALRSPLDGRPFLNSSGLTASRRPEALIEQAREPYTALPAWRSIRSTTVQYVEWYSATGAITAREYYDLVADPYQLTNLLGDVPRTNDPDVTALHQRLNKYATCRGANGATNPCP
jgi:arylsulfatase A-like enzyme